MSLDDATIRKAFTELDAVSRARLRGRARLRRSWICRAHAAQHADHATHTRAPPDEPLGARRTRRAVLSQRGSLRRTPASLRTARAPRAP